MDAQNPDPQVLQEAADLLARGRLVAFPTETVYGLGANALDAAAVDRIFAAKGRPASDPLIVHIYATVQLEQIAATIPDVAWELAHAFWPGPLTLVLPKGPHIPSNVSAGLDSVAVRMPNHRVPYLLFKQADLPVAAPSANLFSRPSPTTAQHVWDDLHGRVDLILDAGPATIGVESTVLDLAGARPLILRPGGLALEALRTIVPDVEYSPRYAALAGDAGLASPGMMLKHYSPNAEVLLFTGPRQEVLARMAQTAAERRSLGQQVGVMIAGEDQVALVDSGALVTVLGSESDLAQIAANLFACMRKLERQGVDVIITRTFGQEGLGLAIADRLIRATEGRIIEVGR